MRRFIVAMAFALLAGCAGLSPGGRGPQRIAVMSAFPPELAILEKAVENRREQTVNGVVFVTGKLSGKDVVLFLSGVSMVNAAMTTQLALDNFAIDRIVFSGIAGGVDPKLDVGDVVVAEQWGQYLESVMARKSGNGFELPGDGVVAVQPFANYGMMYTRSVQVARGAAAPETRFWFRSDPGMLKVASAIAPDVSLKRCIEQQCLSQPPKVVVGGNGVSGTAFVDNAELREWAYKTFEAKVLDMETAAVAHVAYANMKPFIAFRSLSDLAGGDPGKNQARTFFQLASDNSAAVVMAFLKALP